MTWPSTASKTHLDAANDDPKQARPELADLVDKFNQLQAHVSSFMQGVLDDTDDETARATLSAALDAVFTGDDGGSPDSGVKGLVPAPSQGDAVADKFLKADGTWASVTAGTVPLQTETPSNQASVTLDQFDNTKYTRYIVVLEEFVPVTDGSVPVMRLSTDGGSTFASASSSYATGITDSRTPGWSVATSPTYIQIGPNGGTAADENSTSIVDILSATHTDTRTTVVARAHGRSELSAAVQAGLYTGARSADEDTDAVQILASSGNMTAKEIRLYGVI